MTTKIIQVGGYRVGYDPAYSPEEKTVGIIFSADAKSGKVTVVFFPLEKKGWKYRDGTRRATHNVFI